MNPGLCNTEHDTVIPYPFALAEYECRRRTTNCLSVVSILM